jgi:hypothetical protein
MVFLNINTKNYKDKDETGKSVIDTLNSIIKEDPNNKIFILYYMEGCGPCNATRPEWAKIKNALKNLENSNNVAIVDIDQVLSSKIANSKEEPNSFPTIRYITNKGNSVENYEDSNITNKDRAIDSFVEWIKLNTKNSKLVGGRTRKRYRHKRALKNKKSIKRKRTKRSYQKK